MGYRELILHDRPLAYWPLGDIGSGANGKTIRDVTGHGNYGTIATSNPASRSSPLLRGTAGGARWPGTGSGDRIDINWTYAGASNPYISLEAVVAVTAGKLASLVCSDNGAIRVFQWRIETTGALNFFYWSPAGGPYALTSTVAVPASVSTHLVTTLGPTLIRHYMNGELIASGAAPATIWHWWTPFTLLNYGGGASNQSFAGRVSDIAVWGRELTPVDVRARWLALSVAPSPHRRRLR
jgi:hypothetical protein